MAKGALFKSSMRGAIGDVVLYVKNGQQCSRARVRSPRNPKAMGQQRSRAVMSSVFAMYSAGKALFSHSFEGKTSPKANYSRFMKLNYAKLMADFKADIQRGNLLESSSRFSSPKASCPSPYTFIVSEGSLPQQQYEFVAQSSLIGVKLTGDPLQASIEDYFHVGDIFTFVGLEVQGTTHRWDEVSPSSVFGFVRAEVVAIPDISLDLVTFGQLFSLQSYNARDISSLYVISGLSLAQLVTGHTGIGAMAVIKSRKNSELRSSSEFFCTPGLPWGLDYETCDWIWYGNKPVIPEPVDIFSVMADCIDALGRIKEVSVLVARYSDNSVRLIQFPGGKAVCLYYGFPHGDWGWRQIVSKNEWQGIGNTCGDLADAIEASNFVDAICSEAEDAGRIHSSEFSERCEGDIFIKTCATNNGQFTAQISITCGNIELTSRPWSGERFIAFDKP